MADIKKYLSLERLAEYDALLKAKIAQDDAAVLDAAKDYVDQKFDGHTHSWNELTDKPFGEEGSGATIEWDGNTEGRDSFTVEELGPTYYKASDKLPTADELVGSVVTGSDREYPHTVYMTTTTAESDIKQEQGAIWVTGNPFIVVQSVDFVNGDASYTAPSIGVYFADFGMRMSLTYGSTTIKTLDEKYIPDTIARKADLDASITNITNGDIVVKEAEHATSADSATAADSATSAESATKATQDGNGAVIADTYETKADASAKLDEAKEYTDTLKTYVGTIPEGATATDVVGYIQEKTSGIASEGAMTELSNRVGIVEGKVATIEGDYLTSADKTELQTNIDTVSSAVELLTNGVDAETVDGVNDLIAYVNEHGAEVTGMKADIKANADALAELAPVAKTGSWNDLSDRPFYDNDVVESLVTETTIAHGEAVSIGKQIQNGGQTYRITLDNSTTYTLSPVYSGALYLGSSDFSVTPFYAKRTMMDEFTFYFQDEASHVVEIEEIISSEFKQIEEKFIPDTIARVSDIESIDFTPYETKIGADNKISDAIDGLANVAKTGSWSQLIDKPTETVGDLTVQGKESKEGLTAISGKFYDVGSTMVATSMTLEDLANGCTMILESGETKTFNVDDFVVGQKYNVTDSNLISLKEGDYFFIVPFGGYQVDAAGQVVEVVTPGFYFGDFGGINHTLIIHGQETILESYIPDSIARVSDIPVVDLTPYETKEDASAKLTEAKTYVDEKFDGHTHSWNDLEDKPFGDNDVVESILSETTIAHGQSLNVGIQSSVPTGYNLYRVALDNSETYTLAPTYSDALYLGSSDFSTTPFYAKRTGMDTFTFYFKDEVSHVVEIERLVSFETKTLDEKFIPDTIARVEDQDALAERVSTLETWHEGFEEITAEDINGLFA